MKERRLNQRQCLVGACVDKKIRNCMCECWTILLNIQTFLQSFIIFFLFYTTLHRIIIFFPPTLSSSFFHCTKLYKSVLEIQFLEKCLHLTVLFIWDNFIYSIRVKISTKMKTNKNNQIKYIVWVPFQMSFLISFTCLFINF